MTIDELKKALKCHSEDEGCGECPLFESSGRCIRDMARAALDALNTKNELLDQRQMALKTVKLVLDKGGCSVTVNPTGEVWIRPWNSMPWISVNDAKPDKNGDYLVYRGHAVSEDWLKTNDANWLVGICPWNEKMGGWYKMRDNEVDKTVTHWMELPTAPEGWC